MAQKADNFKTDWLETLNPRQQDAVRTLDGALLVLAGAGTGKTRVLSTRLASLLHQGKARPFQIMAVTFTNKAAQEMLHRVESLVGEAAKKIMIGTFHALGLRILRTHADEAGRKPGFTIIDTDDQIRLLKQIFAEMEIDESRWPARAAANTIQRLKDRAMLPKHLPAMDGASFAEKQTAELYRRYQERLETLNVCDFGDLLLLCIELFRHYPPILENWRNRLSYILVDEYQDTNTAQYLWLRLLVNENNNICCVGDDDQSIYGWRGAEIGNILRFAEDFPNAVTIRLEQNYRSTPHILSAASHLIAHNRSRLGKTLWTQLNEGEKISIHNLPDGEEEADYVVERVAQALDRGESLAKMAILVRAGFQTRAFEEALIASSIPYRIIGGQRFYEREEIRDLIAYLRVVQHEADDLAFERILNKPARGIGNTSLTRLRQTARENNTALVHAVPLALKAKSLPAKAAKSLATLLKQFEHWRAVAKEKPLAQLTEAILQESGYNAFWKNSERVDAATKLENIRELVSAMDAMETLEIFLEHVALVMDIDRLDTSEQISIMTIHAAKGLEFDTVFLPGWEEDIFPNKRTLDESGQTGLEEERRLAYVALTRARRRLIITFAALRRVFGQWQSGVPSRFIKELPDEHIEGFSPVKASSSAYGRSRFVLPGDMVAKAPGRVAQSRWQKGQICRHRSFGIGRIQHVQGEFVRVVFENKEPVVIHSDFLTRPKETRKGDA